MPRPMGSRESLPFSCPRVFAGVSPTQMLTQSEDAKVHLWILPSLLCIMFIQFSRYLRHHKELRSKITKSWMWKTQFFCHPVIIFIFLSKFHGSYIATVLLVPFVLNFGVEPWKLPNDLMFYGFFYLHHIAPITLMHITIPHHQKLSQALLFGHAWCLHPIGSLVHWGYVNKEVYSSLSHSISIKYIYMHQDL
ncbi:hypothetical protein AAMO2058_000113400 [Amorphochlora amoebiformis]